MTSSQVRDGLEEALQLDLVGPSKGHPLEAEVLDQTPSRWYLTGFLAPIDAAADERRDETAEEEVDQLSERAAGGDDKGEPEKGASKPGLYPSSIGLSFLIPDNAAVVSMIARWGDYRVKDEERPKEGEKKKSKRLWQRIQRESLIEYKVPKDTKGVVEMAVPESGGLMLAVTVRPVANTDVFHGLLPKGAKAVSVFLVNKRKLLGAERDEAYIFQAEIEAVTVGGFLPRPNPRGLVSDDWDERVADLQYRDTHEFVTGHAVSAEAKTLETGSCASVRTRWIPSAEVERVVPTDIPNAELKMEVLGELTDLEDANKRLGGLVAEYRTWIKRQRDSLAALLPRRKETADELLKRMDNAVGRIKVGIELLGDPKVLDAFKIANRVMAAAARRREMIRQGKTDPAQVGAPAWRPFQLAFVLMNLKGIARPGDFERGVVDLLFFPTGGGKTEAYLGLSAFTLVHRRLSNPGITSAGMSVLMRYTLRLLTLDQLGRAAAMICALEIERKKSPASLDALGQWPFEIGLWVGGAATPNRMGAVGDTDQSTARARTIKFKNNPTLSAPIPLEECPWCGNKFTRNSFILHPNPDQPTNLRILCVNRGCDFSNGNYLPILAVDDPIYRRLPCFLIATVDKFAALPWKGEVGAFFGRVQRNDADGFYGPCAPGRGSALSGPLLPPDLVIQDELHLISGPLGTMVGLYETAIDELCARQIEGRKVGPKILASTATVRRAEAQIRALFNRRTVDIFPPPGPDKKDSFFSKTIPSTETPGRRYLGVAAQGRNLKVVMLRVYLATMAAAQKAATSDLAAADPYMTLLGYFNSLRELGASRRIIEDEVRARLATYSSRKRQGEPAGVFADRIISTEVRELTSRVSTGQVAEIKRRLRLAFTDKERVDVAIATNMISVGLDITRLGLMVVFGQPKTTAEYIQATSRIGRDESKPGLVITLLNIHRPRDRSHYERFAGYHASFYRAVEATSVTPFSTRALDRGLAGTFVGLGRHAVAGITPPLGAAAVEANLGALDFTKRVLSAKAKDYAEHIEPALAVEHEGRVRDRVANLLDEWIKIAEDYRRDNVTLRYDKWERADGQTSKPLLHDFLDPDLIALSARHWKFRANRSMRDVEASVNIKIKRKNGTLIDEEDDN